MNGIHDLGGAQGYGPVEREENEPPFHAGWEPAMVAIMRAGLSQGLYTIDEFRHGIERMDPAEYLATSYYEHWLDGVTRVLVEKGIVEPAELEARTAFFRERPRAGAGEAVAKPPPVVQRQRPAEHPWRRETDAAPRFAPGDAVITRVIHPQGHTRLPRYARGKRGIVAQVHGVCVFPDTNAHGLGEEPQPVYSVRFDAQELWGASAESNDAVHIDLWESYLLPA